MSISNRLRAAWLAFVGRPDEEPDVGVVEESETGDEDEVVEARRKLATAQLELQETQASLAAERSRVEAMEKMRASQTKEGVESQLERLFTQLASPLSQLRTQAALLEAGRPVAASDVMTLALSFAEAVEHVGLEPVGSAGEVMPFRSEIAQPLARDAEIAEDEEVVVKFIGYRYCGRILRKALVERNT